MRIKLKMSFSSMADYKLEALGHVLLSSMSNNPNFPNLPVPIAEFETAFETYVVCLAASKKEGGKNDTKRKQKAKAELAEIMLQYALYVMMIAKNDAVIIGSSGFEIVKQPESIGELAKPDFKIKHSENSGSLEISISTILGAHSYVIEYKTFPVDEQAEWSVITSTKSKLTIYNLKPTIRHVFRVAGVGTSPIKIYSDEKSIIVA